MRSCKFLTNTPKQVSRLDTQSAGKLHNVDRAGRLLPAFNTAYVVRVKPAQFSQFFDGEFSLQPEPSDVFTEQDWNVHFSAVDIRTFDQRRQDPIGCKHDWVSH